MNFVGERVSFGGAMGSRAERNSFRDTCGFDKPLSRFKEFVFRIRPFDYHAVVATIQISNPATAPVVTPDP